VFQAQQAAAFPGVAYTIGCAHMAEDDLVNEPFTVREGFYQLPQKPGMGVTVDEAALDKYRTA
jgi:L-alanine-DL-glutamate epimerase-like enolase superfamily enzyme